MEIDKSWMYETTRCSDRYEKGVEEFLRMAGTCLEVGDLTRCPCRDCSNRYYYHIGVVERHLYMYGIDRTYTRWIFHGEEDPCRVNVSDNLHTDMNAEIFSGDDEVQELLGDVRMGRFVDANIGESSTTRAPTTDGHEHGTSFDRFCEDGMCELYPGCKKMSKIAFILKMLHIKTINNMSNKAFDMMIGLIKEALPDGETLPRSYREAKLFSRDLGFGYELIHACKNDCVLFWKEHADKEQCPTCEVSRWSSVKGSGKKIPQKVLRYFPIKPRLQRLFMSKDIAKQMRWHKDERQDDNNTLRHPADAIVWKEFDKEHEWFARDSRNVRLGLASDGFNPFGNMSTTYSIWPVVITPYNLPPWRCMKAPNMILSLLIPGPTAPGNDIDVYLRPLVDDLHELWNEGVSTYDALTKETFQMHAALLWTINDYPAYANLSGWSTKGKLACPVCNKDTTNRWLKYGNKSCYMGHRRWLPQGHVWRKKKQLFDGNVEHRSKPEELSMDQLLQQLTYVADVQFGKASKKVRVPKRNPAEVIRKKKALNWKKKSIFFKLPYWSTVKLRHILDVMHIEKNICDSVLGTLMNIDGKTKDTVKARYDLREMGIRKELHLQTNGATTIMPHANYTLTRDENKKLCDWLKGVKFPDGYASNIGRCVNKISGKLSGMKSHDCHVFLQRLLPVAIRGYLKPEIQTTLTELSTFFKQLCARTLKVDVLKQMKDDIVVILCKLEQIFPPAFFDIMIHLAIHLPREAELAGPVQYRWMYPIERTLGKYKRYVRNRARPEGSIAEAYIADECLTFCSMYLRGIETRWNREERNAEGCMEETVRGLDVFSQRVRPVGAAKYITLDHNMFARARWYVLNNCKETDSYMDEHYQMLEGCHDIAKKHEANFECWLRDHLYNGGRCAENIPKQLYDLACGPDPQVRSFRGCIVNGVRFHTKERAQNCTTQNCGVVVLGEDEGSTIEFYGELKNILELRYPGQNRVFLFECDWWDTRSDRLKMDRGLTIVNTSRKWYASDPFILASQAAQVFYLNDPKLGDRWKVAQKLTNRNVYDISTVVEGDNEEDDQGISVDVYQERECVVANIAIVEDSTILRRDDATIAIDELYVQLNVNNDDNLPVEEHDTDSNDEEELCSDWDTDDEHTDDELADESEHGQSCSSENDITFDDDMS